MAKYELKAPDGRIVVVEGNAPPSQQDVERIFASIPTARPSLMQRASQAIAGGPREDFPEYIADVSPEEALAAERSMGDPAASIGQDRFGNPVIQTSRGTFYLNKPGLSVSDVTNVLGGAERAIKSAAPYVAGGLAAAPLRAAAQTGVQGAIGLAQEAITQTGRGVQGEQVDWSKLATTPMFAMAGDVAGRVAYRVAAPLVSKIVGRASDSIRVVNPDGTLSDEAIRLLRSSGVSPDEFAALASQEVDSLQRTGVLTREQAERFNFMKGMGIEPTTAQITRTADDFQLQQELAKRTTGVRSALEGQEAAIAGAFDTRIRGVDAPTSGSAVWDAVANKATKLDSEIGRLYGEARAAIPADRNIKFGRFFNTLKSKGPSNQATGGIVASVRGYLKDAGIQSGQQTVIGATGLPTQVSAATPASVGQAEALRIELNRLYQNANKEGRAVIRSLKEALDEDVLRTAGQDYFAQARMAKAEFERGLDRELVNKFDTASESLIRDILDNSIKSDEVFNQAVLGSRWRPNDLRQLTNYLADGSESGAAALRSLRAETMDYIRQKAFVGPVDEAGNQAMSRAALERALNKVGQDKLKVIFNADEVKFLEDMLRLAKLREPVRGTALGRGPSAQAIERLEKSLLSKIPVVGGLADLAVALRLVRAESAAAQRMISPSAGTISAVGRMTPAQTFVGPTAAGRVPAAVRGIGAGTTTQEQR